MNIMLRNMTSVYLSRNGRMLMLYRRGGRVVDGAWVGSAGGHFENEELNDPRACVLRELHEELGLSETDIGDLRLRYITLRNVGGEIRQNYYFFAELKEGVDEALSSNEGDSKWFGLNELPLSEMPFTAKFVIEHYLREGINSQKLYGGVATEDDFVFVEMAD